MVTTPGGTLKGVGLEKPMSALGQKRTCAVQKGMSALPPKADIVLQFFPQCYRLRP